jgi:hypothetical protein
MPHELIRAEGHDRNRSLGWLGLAWIEHFCVHGPGDVQGRSLNPNLGDSLPLDDEFAGIIVDNYALESTGRRMYDSVFTSRAKGRAKSELAGFEVLLEGFGPCRFAGFAEGGEQFKWRDFTYTYQPGEPMGRPIVYPVIRCLATEEGQAGNTYDNVYFNLTEGPLSEGLASNVAGLTRTLLPHGGEIIPSTASNAAKDGGKETFVVFDESHLYILPELRRMYATVRRNLAKRKSAEPWSHETSTMYLPGEDSVAEESHKLAKLILAGKTKRSRLLFDHVEAPADVDLTDEKSLLSALREVYGPFSESMDLQRIIDEIWDPRNDVSDSRRYYLNQPTSATDAWVTQPEWKACLAADKVIADREPVTLGFDGSRKRARGVTDATALIGCRVSDGHLFEIQVWEQPTGPAGADWQVPAVEVDAAVRSAFSRYNVVGFYCDPAKWETYVAGWEAAYSDKLKVKASREHPCEWWMTGGRASITVRALREFHNALTDREMTHDGSHHLTKHVLAARRRPSRVGLQISKENPDSPNKIDAAIAAVLAWTARVDAVSKGIGKATRPAIPRRIR